VNNKASRALAVQLKATHLEVFEQVPKDQSCQGYVATWIRRRSKGRTFFRAAVNPGESSPWAIQKTNKQNQAVWMTVSQFVGGKNVKKHEALAQSFKADEEVHSLQQKVDFGRATKKVEYITGGNDGAHPKRTLERIAGAKPRPVADDGSGIEAIFLQIAHDKAIGSIIYTSGNRAHNVGLDARGGVDAECVFFDPAIGEFTFPNFTLFLAWWSRCFSDRKDGHPNAWSGIDANGMATADVFRPPII
jgi:hypothetical protein